MNHDADIELGLKLHLRNGPDIAPNLDGTYDVPSGDQAPNRAKWNFDFSVNTGIEGSTNTLDDFDFRIVIESGDGERGVFNLQHVAPGVTPWLSSNGNGASTTRMAQDQGTSLADRLRFLTNSVNLGFAFMQAIFGTDYNDAGEHYDIYLQAFDHNRLIGAVHQSIDVV